MTEQGHKYTFHGFHGPYWEAKEKKAEAEKLRLTEGDGWDDRDEEEETD